MVFLVYEFKYYLNLQLIVLSIQNNNFFQNLLNLNFYNFKGIKELNIILKYNIFLENFLIMVKFILLLIYQ